VLDQDPASINERDVAGQTALHWAARMGNIDAVRKLLCYEADASARELLGWTPLHFAAQNYNGSIMVLLIFEALVEEGAEVNRRDNYGNTPLAYAIHHNNVPVFRALRRLGVELDFETSAGQTVLHVAAWWAKSQILRDLID
ncbi:ankyrin, partial [Coniochaeta ligniaria NRRL 30616]